MNEMDGPGSTGGGMRVGLFGWGLPEFGDYARFYWHAGGCLIEASQTNRGNLSQLVFPTLYVYRHALELALKDANIWADTAVLAAGSLGAVDQVQVINAQAIREEMRVHRLRPLLDRLQSRIAVLRGPVAPQIPPSKVESRIGPAVHALEAVDVDGQRFRYPYMSKGKASWTREEHADMIVDLQTVRDHADRALAYLLDEIADIYSSFVEEVFENERFELFLEQAHEAHQRVLNAEAAWGFSGPAYGMGLDSEIGSDPGLIDEAITDLSAEMLDDGDD